MERVCDRYSGLTKTARSLLAHTYDEAVHVFGSVAATRSDLDRAAAIMRSGLATAA